MEKKKKRKKREKNNNKRKTTKKKTTTKATCCRMKNWKRGDKNISVWQAQISMSILSFPMR